MQFVNIKKAGSSLPKLIKRVRAGERVIVGDYNFPVVELIPSCEAPSKSKPGVLKGKIWSSEDCWNAEQEIIDLIESNQVFPK